MADSPQLIAGLFAAALDAEDYEAASEHLAEDCVYRIDGAVATRPDAIIDLYRANGDAARGRFDQIQYFSAIQRTGRSTAAITFTDRIRLGERWHEFHCRQHIRVNSSGLIASITHEDLPNERQQLAAFEATRAGGTA